MRSARSGPLAVRPTSRAGCRSPPPPRRTRAAKRDPLAARFDDVLEAIGDLDEAVLIHIRDITCVEVTVAPQLLAELRFLVIALGEPGRPRDDFAGGASVARYVVAVLFCLTKVKNTRI